MITQFSTLYAGHILEGEGIGFDGIPHDDRWYSNERLIEVFDIAKESAILMDELGYDVLWMAEHHFQREGYECIPNLLMLSQYLCQFTTNLKFGCGFNILPMWHPIRIAEDFAMADILTEDGSSSVLAEAITPARSRHLALLCWTRTLTENCLKSSLRL